MHHPKSQGTGELSQETVILNLTSCMDSGVLWLWVQLSSDLHSAPPKYTQKNIQENYYFI